VLEPAGATPRIPHGTEGSSGEAPAGGMHHMHTLLSV